MDPATLATTVTTLLAPYIAKAGVAILDRAAAALPNAPGHLLDTIIQHFEGKPAAAATIMELAHNPSDTDQHAAFALQLKMALKNDPEFMAVIQDLAKKASAEAQAGGHNVTITTGNVSNSAIVLGDNNSVKSGGEFPTDNSHA